MENTWQLVLLGTFIFFIILFRFLHTRLLNKKLQNTEAELKTAHEKLENAQAQLLQSEKLQSVGRLSSGVVHEINTPIQYVRNNLRFLEESFKDLDHLFDLVIQLDQHKKGDPEHNRISGEISTCIEELDLAFLQKELPKSLEQSIGGLSRVSEIVLAMKEFSHQGGRDKKEADINHILKNAVIISSNEWKNLADIDFNLDETIPGVNCYQTEISQAFLNILVNAAQALAEVNSDGKDKGVITLTTQLIDGDVEVAIADNGPGIPENVRPHIFESFYTTKDVGKGTGQGLAIAYATVVEKHGGTLTCKSKEGEGAEFTLTLPVR